METEQMMDYVVTDINPAIRVSLKKLRGTEIFL